MAPKLFANLLPFTRRMKPICARWSSLGVSLCVALAMLVADAGAQQLQFQGGGAAIGGASGTGGGTLVAPGAGGAGSISTFQNSGGGSVQPMPLVPAGQVALAVSARYGREGGAIPGGLHWRVFADKPEPNGTFKLIKEEKTPNAIFLLPPGGYVVHVAFGLASSTRRVQLRSETVREVFDLPAGGARFEGRVGDTRIPSGQISFEVFPGSQFEVNDRRPVVQDVLTGDVVLLPEGIYHVVSNYGDGNAVMRADIRVSPGKLADTIITHRAARITLKLVGESGGEALANTAWSVLTPGGDVVKESIGAFPTVILAEGDYVAIARNEGKVYNRDFKVEPGFDREVEVIAKSR